MDMPMNVSQQIMQPGVPGRALVEVGDQLPAHTDRVDISKSISFLQRHFWLIAAVIALLTVAVDFTYAVLDPRVRSRRSVA